MITLFIISLLGILALFAEIFQFKKSLPLLIITGMVIALAADAAEWNNPVSIPGFNTMLVFNHFALAFSFSLCLITLLWFLMAHGYIKTETAQTDHYALILFALAGAVIMAAFGNLVMLFLGIEILSIPLYILAGSRKTDLASNEAAFKYFLLGAFASGFLLFGIALVYGATGSFELSGIDKYLTQYVNEIPAFFYTGVFLIICGLSFKISAAPFHFWAPDVYQGSPNMITAFMSTIVKTAAFAGFYRLFSSSFFSVQGSWSHVVWAISAITLVLGNVTAIQQVSFKRMLAYSSISHAGYLLLAILAINSASAGALFIYTLAYSTATITAFTVLNKVYTLKSNDLIEGFNGLAERSPLLAFSITVAMLSLAGIPPTGGFFGKYLVFTTAFISGYPGLVIIAIIASLIGVYYYFKIIIASWFKPSDDRVAIELSFQEKLLLILTTLITLFIGIFPGLILNLFS